MIALNMKKESNGMLGIKPDWLTLFVGVNDHEPKIFGICHSNKMHKLIHKWKLHFCHSA